MDYSAHSKPPLTHSKTKPRVRMAIKVADTTRKVLGLEMVRAAGKGNSKAISKSKSRNNIATRKNRNENGRRADFIGSNPHS